ncbi:MAG TPA: DinB family protein [Gemmatimonadaceae bacterium]|nr:DinB family protein [Gemmatimonadaceae bacterium]
MPLQYSHIAIPDDQIPSAAEPLLQHALDTYASETNKTVSVWREFADGDLGYRPHERASSIGEILKHQLLSERRFFGEFLGAPEPPPSDVLPDPLTTRSAAERLVALARPRLSFLAEQRAPWWTERVAFFDVERERIWIFWRRVLHSAHHRTQLATYLRVMGRAVPATYGPTADVRWDGADPTRSVEAAGRK